MPRLNIEDEFFIEANAIAQKIGSDIDRVYGNALRFLNYAQAKHRAGKEISEDEFKAMGFLDELFPFFAKRTPSGVQAKGSERHFAWLEQKKEAGKRGGSASPSRDRDEKGRLLPKRNPNELQAEPNDVQASSSFSSSIEVEEEGKTSESKKPRDVFKPQSWREAYDGMTDDRKENWKDLYPDLEYIERTLTRAFAYYFIDHKDQLPTSRRGWSKAFSHWLETGWARHRAGKREGAPLKAVKNETAGADWEAEAVRLFADIKKFGNHDSDERKQHFLGYDRWYVLGRSGLLTKVRSLPENDWSKKQLARDLKEAFERFGSQVPAVNS